MFCSPLSPLFGYPTDIRERVRIIKSFLRCSDLFNFEALCDKGDNKLTL
jgi:hypothetical protein